MSIVRWPVGDLVVTVVLETQTDHIPPELFFPEATADAVAAHGWTFPDFADAAGNIGMAVQAFVVETPTRTILVDPCVGNGKTSAFPFWHQQSWPFLERFAAAGFTAERIDVVVHTHLHVDHIGWDTTLVDGAWVPTFPNARHLYTQDALDALLAGGGPDDANALRESVQPILDAGLADVVADDADLGEGLRLEGTPGHTPGHVSLHLASAGADAVLSGDVFHHPVQCAEPTWAEIGDADPDQARSTRRRILGEWSASGATVFGTHFPTKAVGRIVADGDAWRFEPLDAPS